MKNVSVWWAELEIQKDISIMACFTFLANGVHLQLLHIATLKPSAVKHWGTIYRPP